MSKKNIAVIFGGRSTEHEISVISANQAMDSIDVTRYNVIPVYIAQTGKWYTGNALRDKKFYKTLPTGLDSLKNIFLKPEPNLGGLSYLTKGFPFGIKEEIIPVDVMVPVFHGSFGEDGCIQGLFEMANIPYASSGVLGSSVAMSKYVCKKYLEVQGVPTLPSCLVQKRSFIKNSEEVINKITQEGSLKTYPLFVKPNNLGSSVGVSKAKNKEELLAGLAKVFQFDLQAIVEPCITNIMEINVSVMESLSKQQTMCDASVVEIPVASGDFLSYEDKYLRNGKGKKGPTDNNSSGMANLTRMIDPEDLDPRLKEEVISLAKKSFELLSCSGVGRFDFMFDLDKNQLYFNELNPIPGSLSFYLWEKSTPALVLTEVMDRIIEGALERFADKARLKLDFGFKALKN